MANEIQGLDIVFEVQEDGDSASDWQVLVCEIDSQSELTNDVTEVDTKCGTFAGIKEMKGNYTGNAVCNATPTATEASYEDVVGWQKDRTRMNFRFRNTASGSVLANEGVFQQGEGYFVASTLQGTNGEIVQFSWTFKPVGEISITAP